MRERPADDTTKEPPRAPHKEGGREPGNYYYDDGTGYEPYDPADDSDDEPAEETHAGNP